MPRLPAPYDAHLDVLFEAQLLCDVCQDSPWIAHGSWHAALLCAACGAAEREMQEAYHDADL